MIIGSVKEILDNEFRVGMTPADAAQYIKAGHTVLLESGAGATSGFTDEAYQENGATLVAAAPEVWERADMIVKVKEPQVSEYELMREGQIIYTFFHMAANPALTQALLEKKVTAFAYETITDDNGRLPLLNPMSQIAGRLSVMEGARMLMVTHGGSGILLTGVPGVRSANVLILGGGVAGTNAAVVARGMGANVTIMDVNLKRLEELDLQYNSTVATIYSNDDTIESNIKDADLVISTVLIPGRSAPKLVKRRHIEAMKPGSVIVDVAIDQGGSTEVSRPTTHSEPTYVEHGVVMYCVANIPGAVPFTSSKALCNATIPHGLKIANQGAEVIRDNPNLLNGLNTYQGHVTHRGVAESLELEYVDPLTLIS